MESSNSFEKIPKIAKMYEKNVYNFELKSSVLGEKCRFRVVEVC
jgi:hypothetical protein